MNKIIVLLGSAIGGAVGWWLGNFVGLYTAVSLSAVGTGAGVYYARKWAKEYLP